MKQIAILSNPASTQNRRIMPRVRRFVETHSDIFHVEIQKIGDVSEALRLFSRADIAVLVINGGDGTIQATLSALVNDKPFGGIAPPVAVLPGGKSNMIAHDLGMKKRPEQELERLFELAQAGRLQDHVVIRHLIGIDIGDGRPRRYGMFFGAAGIVSAIQYCREHIFPLKLPNVLSYIMAIWAIVFSSLFLSPQSPRSAVRAEPMRINARGGGIIDGCFFMVVATTLDRLILNAQPFAQAKTGAIRFSCIEHRPMTIIRSVLAIIFGYFGKTTVNGAHVRNVDILRIETSEKVTLDGEFYLAADGKPIELDGRETLPFIRLPS